MARGPFTENRRLVRVELNVSEGPPTGPPLLALHGVTRRWQDFSPLLPALSCRWQVYGLDFRGHGASDHPGNYHVIDYVDDAVSILSAHIRDKAVLFGHSLGALVALAAAARAPDRVRAVILEDPPAPRLVAGIRQTPFFALFSGMKALAGSRRPVGEMARALAEVRLPAPGGGTVRFGDVRDATAVRFAARCLRDVDPEVLTPVLEGGWLEGYDVGAISRHVNCPVLLLRGDETQGGMLPAADARELAGGLADCTQVDVPGAGHLLHWLATDAVARWTLGFLETLS